MSHAILLCILYITEREKSKITSLATTNRPGDTPKQREEMSHNKFSRLVLPCFMIFWLLLIFVPPRSVQFLPVHSTCSTRGAVSNCFWLCVLTNFQTCYRWLQFFWQSFVFFIDLFPLSLLAFDCLFAGVSLPGCCSFPSSAVMSACVRALSTCQD